MVLNQDGTPSHPIYSVKGEVIGTSRNLAGIRRYVATSRLYIERYEVSSYGLLCIHFSDGSYFHTTFASYSVLCDWSARWRNVRGAPLYIQGKCVGTLQADSFKCEVES